MSASNISFSIVEAVLSFLGTTVSAGSFWRDSQYHEKEVETAKYIHKTEIEQEKKYHQEECELAKKQHEREIGIAKHQHIREMNSELELHFHQLNADLINATRDAERDMYDQRNAELQTLILCSTVMFSAEATVIIQGNLPVGINDIVYCLQSAISGFSFALLFFCIVLSTKIVLRSTLFMYRRANRQSKRVYLLIEKTITFMGKLRYANEVFCFLLMSLYLSR